MSFGEYFWSALLSYVVGAIMLEIALTDLRAWRERRRLKRKRREWRMMTCAGPAADYCELHGECPWCCRASGGNKCRYHGVQL